MTFAFERDPGSGLIIVNVEIDGKFELNMVLDTGATNIPLLTATLCIYWVTTSKTILVK